MDAQNTFQESRFYEEKLMTYLQEQEFREEITAEFVKSRAEEAAQIFKDSIKAGYPTFGSYEIAVKALFSGLDCSFYQFVENVIEENLDDSLASSLPVEEVVTAMRKTDLFSKFCSSDEFISSPSGRALYFEMINEVTEFYTNHGKVQ